MSPVTDRSRDRVFREGTPERALLHVGRDAAVDADRGPRNRAGAFACKECDQVADFLWCRKPPIGISTIASSTTFWGSDPVRAATVAATPSGPSHNGVLTGPGATPTTWDPLACELEREPDREVVHRGLARTVRVDQWAGKMTVYARDVDDHTATLDQVWERCTGGANRGHQVQLEKLRPLRVGLVGEARERRPLPTLLTTTSRDPSRTTVSSTARSAAPGPVMSNWRWVRPSTSGPADRLVPSTRAPSAAARSRKRVRSPTQR